MQLIPRRRLFVDRRVQGALLYRVAIYWCFSVLVVSLITLCVRALVYSGPADSFFDYFAFGEFFAQYAVVVLASLVLVPIVMLDLLFISNRFAGPLYRMRRSMRAVASGECVRPLKFREKDFLHELSQEFNAVIDRLEQLEKELDETKRQANEPRDFHPAVSN